MNFGDIYESILNPETRHSGGIHFTSSEVIHRTIDPLLDSQDLSDAIFFDPACGSGNFLLEIFRSHKISVDQLIGIELNDFSACVARVSIFLESKKFPRIIHGNSLRLDWKKIVRGKQIYIVGNPPFLGYSLQTPDQKLDVRRIFDGWGKLDYAACWFKLASDFMHGTNFETAFVVTSSICQGESVGILWKKLFELGIKINFANRSFKWDLSASVHCSIIGFAMFDRAKKFIDGVEVQNINGYLRDLPSICIESRSEPRFDVPKMILGNLPRDGGNLIVEPEDLWKFENVPRKFLRRFIGAEEFLKNRDRYCLWLEDAPQEILEIPAIKCRIDSCREFRLSSKRAMTRSAAKMPHLFAEIRQPSGGNYILVPATTSGERKYVPIDFISSEVICSDAVLMIPNANLWIFGILSSIVHMEWMRIVAGYLGSSYRYSAVLVYNNFPFPKFDPRIESTAQKILDARKKFRGISLAKLYDEMPSELQTAHEENDRSVLDSYGFSPKISIDEMLTKLLQMSR